MINNGLAGIIISDQNFTPALLRDFENAAGCIAIVRLEDASLHDLADLVIEIFDKHAVPSGSVFLLGSASHLISAGVGSYVADWVAVNQRLNQKFKNINICPLIPILFEDSPGLIARELEILAMWLHKVYDTGIRGLSELWRCVVSHTQSNSGGHTQLQYDDVIKITLPVSLSSPGTETFFYKFSNSCPARLRKMDRKTIDELIRILISILQEKFSVAICSEGILPRAPPQTVDPKGIKHVVCIGSSIIRQTVPYLKALGYSVTDLSRLGWLATQENINALILQMSQLQLPPGFSVVFDLLGNASHRYEQLDGTQALPSKENGQYHMPGPVVTCDVQIFCRIIKSLEPVMMSAQDAVKVSVPPLPRYIFSACCNNPHHCTNLS
jgi:hypothetical protein